MRTIIYYSTTVPKMNLPIIFLSFLLAFLSVSCQSTDNQQIIPQKSFTGDSVMVVSPHPLASEVGVSILRSGGNAVDAAVAVQFTLAVVYPRAGNLGGGGFMLIRSDEGVSALDYRERAPLAADRDMYLDSLGEVVEGLSLSGHLAAGVPGTVDGLIRAWEEHGQITELGLLIDPAIRLAEEGYPISQTEADRLNSFANEFRKHNAAPVRFLRDGGWNAGDILVQPELARTLRRIRAVGRAGFYAGETALLILQEMRRGEGLLTQQDLDNYEAVWRTPVRGNYRGYEVYSMPPPSSGGVALLQMLEMLEPYNLRELGHLSPGAIHLMVEAMRRAYADRAAFLGDADYVTVPIEALLDTAYLREKMLDFQPMQATASEAQLEEELLQLPESFETTHTSVVDAEGNAVSVTTTLNSNYGCKVVVEGGGFFLNNEMDDFSVKPGQPNQFGLIGAEANAIEPGKRMLSSMTPTLLEKDGELFMVLGTPGGSTIITSVLQVLVNVIDFQQGLDEAIEAPRFHHQWLPDELWYEQHGFESEVLRALEQRGHKLKAFDYIARMKAVQRLPDGRLFGVGDFRQPDDDARGY